MTAGNNVTLKDSYLWFSCKLRNLSNLWCLPVRKFYFNHSWNTNEMLSYTGPWPTKEEFDVPQNEIADFDQWYSQASSERPIYRRWDELVLYCQLRGIDSKYRISNIFIFYVDVELLYLACQKFRALVLNYESIDPFKVSISIASLTAYTYRKSYLLPETIPLILDKNCAAIGLRQQSNIALKYLSWLARTEYLGLRYAGNGPEHRIGNYKVDGFVPDSNVIIEIFGDVIHSCPIHTDADARHPLKPHLTNGDVFDSSMAKIDDLQKMNFSVKVIWECEIKEMLKGNEEMKKWFENRIKWNDLTEPIQARDALHGGRVEAFVLLLELDQEMITAGWRINYLDVVSLYPFVQSNPSFYYPVSHPIIINGCDLVNEGQYTSEEELGKYFGIVSATCYGPPKLLIPVLPVKHPDSGRLIFPLCGQCGMVADNDGIKVCSHTGEERSFRGCWTTPELLRALQLGYRIVKIHQIWHFDQKSNLIFRDYVRTWSRLKYAASGWPEECQTDCQKEEFLAELKYKYDIVLNKEEIQKNIPLRTLCKHFLNNLWGKLSTRLDRMGRNVEFVATEQELISIMKNERKELVALGALTDKYAIVETETKDQFQFSAFHNPILASFVTSYARLVLLEHLLRPDPSRIIYTDTDSIVYLANINEPDPYRDHRGNFLGMLKNEMDTADDYIVRWVSLGSKNYSFETSRGKLIHRSKGLVIPESVSSQFKFNLVKAVLLKDSKTIRDFYASLPDQELAYRLQEEMFQSFPNEVGVLLPQPLISRNFKKNEDVTTHPERTKFLRFYFTKRKLVDNKLERQVVQDVCTIRLRSVPWGYQRE